ncbi:MAG: hypothetical protein ACUVXA_16510 [Candidatus Jordarchaeum sp.]|uniref:hypothetical protein n=1 Tax=Candidatus Jordarchaeum sp. TaxID=2823881 RepID=UPI00404A3D43
MSRGAILTGFAGGIIGAITSVLGIIWFAAALTIVMSFWSSIFSPFFFGASPATLALVIIVAVLFAVTCILVGIGFYGIGQIGGGAMGTASLIVGIVLGSAFGVLSIVGVLVFPLLSTISYVVLGVTFIIFGAASITMHEVTMHPSASMAAGIIAIIGGVFIILLGVIGGALMFVSFIIWAIVFYSSREM